MKTKLTISGLCTAICCMCLYCQPPELAAGSLKMYSAWYAFWTASACVSVTILFELIEKYIKRRKRNKKHSV